jgi:hypothetical protein
LAHSLRESGGVPGICSIAEEAIRASEPALIPDVTDRTGSSLLTLGEENANTRLALDCARAWQLAPPAGVVTAEDFVVDVLIAYSKRHCLEKVSPRLVANGTADATEARRLAGDALAAAPLREIARQLLAREDASTLRAPSRARRSAESLLDTPFSELPS